MKLYKFQKQGVETILETWVKHPTQCLSWYTGAGKTNVFIEVCTRLIKDNPKVKIGISACLTSEIKDQIFERLNDFGLAKYSQKIISYQDFDPNKNIYVFNPQTVYRRLDKINFKFDYFIIDESHIGLTEHRIMLNNIMHSLCTLKTRKLLVSATPWDTLAQKRFQNIPTHKRSLDQGFKDRLVTDFRFHAEEAQITFEEKDFTRVGDLNQNAASLQMSILKSACEAKFEHIINNHSKQVGKKCLVICPPGNTSEIARHLSETYENGLAFLQFYKNNQFDENFVDTKQNLERFKTDKNINFLFVTHKCQVGFDMEHLSSVIDLTMSRNIKTLAQRCGRIARKHKALEKHYFYVYDKSLMQNQLEWIMFTMIDFCLGHYDGWTTKTAKYRTTRTYRAFERFKPFSISILEIIETLKNNNNIKTHQVIQYVKSFPPTQWTKDSAIAYAKQYVSRTDMWEKRPGLYKWLRLNAKAEMDALFPLKNRGIKQNEWSLEKVIETMKKCKDRQEFNRTYAGALRWMLVNLDFKERAELRNKHMPIPKGHKHWNEFLIKEMFNRCPNWSKVENYPRAVEWMKNNNGLDNWKNYYLEHFKSKRAEFRKIRISKSTRERYKQIATNLKLVGEK